MMMTVLAALVGAIAGGSVCWAMAAARERNDRAVGAQALADLIVLAEAAAAPARRRAVRTRGYQIARRWLRGWELPEASQSACSGGVTVPREMLEPTPVRVEDLNAQLRLRAQRRG